LRVVEREGVVEKEEVGVRVRWLRMGEVRMVVVGRKVGLNGTLVTGARRRLKKTPAMVGDWRATGVGGGGAVSSSLIGSRRSPEASKSQDAMLFPENGVTCRVTWCSLPPQSHVSPPLSDHHSTLSKVRSVTSPH
jgi:hypothetical protein